MGEGGENIIGGLDDGTQRTLHQVHRHSEIGPVLVVAGEIGRGSIWALFLVFVLQFSAGWHCSVIDSVFWLEFVLRVPLYYFIHR